MSPNVVVSDETLHLLCCSAQLNGDNKREGGPRLNATTLLILIVGVALILGCITAWHWVMKWASQAEPFHAPGTATSEEDREIVVVDHTPSADVKPEQVQEDVRSRKSA